MLRDDRGFALVTVLWTLVILTLLAGVAMQVDRTSRHLEQNTWQRLQLEAAAESALTQAVLSLLDDRPGRHWPVDGRPTELTVNGFRLVVRIQDELGRVDLNTAPRDLISEYLVGSGVSEAVGNIIADNILRWREADQQRQLGGVASKTGTNNDTDIRQGPFRILEEAQHVTSMTPAIFERTKAGFTVYSRRPSVDRAVASRSVLLSLPGITPGAADELIALRSSAGRNNAAANAFGAPLAGRAYWISVAIEHDGRRYDLARVVRLLPSKQIYWVLQILG